MCLLHFTNTREKVLCPQTSHDMSYIYIKSILLPGSSVHCKLIPQDEVWWLVSVVTSISRWPFVMCSTGYQSSSGSHTRLQRWRSGVFVRRARRISLTSVRQFRQLPDVPSYALHTMVTSLFWLRNRRHLAVVAFTLLRLLSGTVYQLTFSTSTSRSRTICKWT